MTNIFATAMTKLPVRLLLGGLCAFVSWTFGHSAIGFALIGIADTDLLVSFLGIGGTLGLLGWWVRITAPPAFIASRPTFRRLLFFCLILGTGSMTYVALDLGGPWKWISVPAALAGVAMSLGTFGSPGPNNSFKPNPLRGSA